MVDHEEHPVVILAAGLGARLRSTGDLPKPLRAVNGKPLLLRVIDRFRDAGIREAVVVVGYRSEEVKAALGSPSGMTLTFAFNPEYKKNNGLSVLAAKPAVAGRSFFLTMADHVFDASLIEGLKSAPLPPDGLVLAVDRKLDAIYDMDDATKVQTDTDRIIRIGKALDRFDAVDTGLFRCTPAVFDAIEKARDGSAHGDCTLSEAIERLAPRGLARVHDIGDGRWQDVDTPGALNHAEKLFE